jgi:ATP-dependent DNA helicase RecG
MKENQQVEWKSSWRDDYLKWICGFANAEGGTLIIGRDDRGVAVGVEDARRLMEEIPNKVRDILGIMVDVNLREVDGRDTVEILVAAYPNPISYKGEYYYRSGSTNQMLKGSALDRFLLRKHGRTWDSVPLPRVTPADLSTEALKNFRALARKSQRLPDEVLEEPDRDLLERLHLVENAYLTRAAVLLFHSAPDRFFTGSFVKIGYFEGKVDLRYQDEIQGDLITQVDKTIEVLKAKYLRAWITYEGIQRIETWPMPMPALREAVLNAVAHRDYAVGTPIQISVYPDKLMIWNPGELPRDWTLEKLLGKHVSIPYNPDIANVFFRAGMIEAWGRGIERILDACREAGTPEPELRYESTGLWVIFSYLPEHRTPIGPVTGEVPGRTPVETTSAQTTPLERGGITTPITTPMTTPMTTPIERRLVELILANPGISQQELAVELGLTRDGIRYHLKKMSRAGSIRHVGPPRGGRWEVLQ